jgi:hypothetical protein
MKVRGSRTAEPGNTSPVSTRHDVTPDAGPHHGQHPGSTWPAPARPATQYAGSRSRNREKPTGTPARRRTYGQVHYNVFDASLPFGGYKQSGWGREMGHEVLNAYTQVKAVTAQLG